MENKLRMGSAKRGPVKFSMSGNRLGSGGKFPVRRIIRGYNSLVVGYYLMKELLVVIVQGKFSAERVWLVIPRGTRFVIEIFLD